MKDKLPLITIAGFLITVAVLIYRTGGNEASAWAAIRANAEDIAEIKEDTKKIETMSEDIAVIKEIMKRYEQQLRDRSYLQ